MTGLSPLAVYQKLQKEYVVETLGLQALPNHIHEIALAFILYHTIFTYLAPWVSIRWFPQSYKKFDRRSALDWKLQCVSLVQSLLICSLACLTMAKLDSTKLTAEQRIWGYSPLTGTVQALASGYFLWDLSMMTQHFQDLGWPMLVHALSCFTVYMLSFVSDACVRAGSSVSCD
jgi:hypothetical protein